VHALVKDEQDLVERILAAVDAGNADDDLIDLAQQYLTQSVNAGGEAAAVQIGVSDDKDKILALVNDKAIDYAKERSAEMVGMRWDGDELVPNPNTEWQIDESTREMLRDTIRNGLDEGLSNDELADIISDSYAFSDERAEVIARTETAFADVEGNLALYRESGMVSGKEWLTSPDCCDECAALSETVVGLDEEFPNDGGEGPPLHPNCECDVLPVLAEEDPDK
jgi:SPP1 gp7 family putative phage head morphogenesis protein